MIIDERQEARTLSWGDIDLPVKTKNRILHGCKCDRCVEDGRVPGHDRPTLSWKEHCPVETGDEIILYSLTGLGKVQVPQVSIKIIGVKRTKTGAFTAEYTVRDDRGAYLAEGNQGDAHGYTRSSSASIDPEAPALDPIVVQGYAKEANVKNVEHRNKKRRAEDPKKRERRMRERIRILLSSLNGDEELAAEAAIEHLLSQLEEGSKLNAK